MPTALDSWYSDWRAASVVVLGLGPQGFSVADTLVDLGASVTVVDSAADSERRTILAALGISIVEDASDVASTPSLVVDAREDAGSQPVARDMPWQDVLVIHQLDLAWRLADRGTGEGPVTRPPWISITGAAGVGQTQFLVSAIVQAAGLSAGPCGTHGMPVFDALRDLQRRDVLIVEADGADWAACREVAPTASVCVVESGDEDRDRLLGAVYERTSVACVYGIAHERVRQMVEEADVQEGARAIGVTLGAPGPSDVGVVDGVLVDRAFHPERRTSAFEIGTMRELLARRLASPAEIEIVLAAGALARATGVSAADVVAGILSVERPSDEQG